MIQIRPGSLVLTTSALVLALPLLAAAQQRRPVNLGEQSTVEFELRRWRSDLDFELRLSAPGVPGTTIDEPDDLGFPAERTWDYHFAVRLLSRLKLRGNWFKVEYAGQVTPASEICIAGLCAPAGTELSSSLELEQTRAGAEVELLRGMYVILAVVGEYGRLETRTGFETSSASATPEPLLLELPLFGLKARVYLTPALALTAEGVGMKEEDTGVWTDFDASATYNVKPNFAFSYGYRNSYFRDKSVETEGDRAVFRLRGQYFSVTVRF
jgi:hypothetical protein